MNSTRTLIAYLTMLMLPLGNIAGWMHVGCVNHSEHCCVGHVGNDSDPSPCQGDLCGDHSSAVTPGSAGSRCCNLSLDRSLAEMRRAAASSEEACPEDRCHRESTSGADEAGESGREPHVPNQNEHDHDRCSVCQSFYSSRHALAGESESPTIELLQTFSFFALPTSFHVDDLLSNSISERGPPRA